MQPNIYWNPVHVVRLEMAPDANSFTRCAHMHGNWRTDDARIPAVICALIAAKSVLPAALFWAGIILLAIGMLTTWYPFAGVIPIYIL